MSEYTPTTEEVRNSAAFGAALAAVIPDEAMDIDFPEPGLRVAAKSAFDRWLAAHDREVAAKAWEACLDAIDQNELNTEQARIGNPYRAALVSEPSTPEGGRNEV